MWSSLQLSCEVHFSSYVGFIPTITGFISAVMWGSFRLLQGSFQQLCGGHSDYYRVHFSSYVGFIPTVTGFISAVMWGSPRLLRGSLQLLLPPLRLSLQAHFNCYVMLIPAVMWRSLWSLLGSLQLLCGVYSSCYGPHSWLLPVAHSSSYVGFAPAVMKCSSQLLCRVQPLRSSLQLLHVARSSCYAELIAAVTVLLAAVTRDPIQLLCGAQCARSTLHQSRRQVIIEAVTNLQGIPRSSNA